MSWQRDFDANGPTWEGNAAFIRNEKRLQEMWDSINNANEEKATKIIDQSKLDDFENKMHKLYNKEKAINSKIDNCNDPILREELIIERSKIRRLFHSIREEYVEFRKSNQ